MSYKVDFHTHTEASPDGALQLADYERLLQHGKLHCIAITDHNTTEMAFWLQSKLGSDHIIIGEEITAKEGELIGLYLKKTVPAGLSAAETVERIHAQGGLVYVPHPFETVRKGLSPHVLNEIADQVDIIEVHNGRAVFQNYTKQARSWSERHSVPGAAASDAHGRAGWGKTFTILPAMPTRDTLLKLLGEASYERHAPGVRGVLYPKLNRIRKRSRRA